MSPTTYDHWHPIPRDYEGERAERCAKGRCGYIECSAEELLLIDAERSGEPVEFRARKGFGAGSAMTHWLTGTVVSTMLYDGIMAKVVEHDPDERIVWGVIPSCGDDVRAASR